MKISEVMAKIAEAKKAAVAGSDREVVAGIVREAVSKSASAVHMSEPVAEGDNLQDLGDRYDMGKSLLLKSADGDQVLGGFQDWADTCYQLQCLMGFQALREGRPGSYDVRKSFYYRDGVRQHSRLAKALNATTANQGQSWVPTLFSAKLIDLVRLQLKVVALFQQLTMPSDPFTIPVAGADSTAYLLGESTSDTASKITATQYVTGSVTLTSKKLGARTLFTEEVTEDSIIAIAPQTRANLALAIARALETATVNGDTAGSHQDSDVTSSADARKAWDGLRKLCASQTKVDCGFVAPTLAQMRATRALMGVYGIDPTQMAILTSMAGFIRLLNLEEVKTVDKYGNGATVLSGELARVDGIPIVVSEFVRADLGASGVYDGTLTNRTEILMVNKPAYVMGTRREVTLKAFEDSQTDQTVLTGTTRKVFKNYFTATTNYAVGLMYNVPI